MSYQLIKQELTGQTLTKEVSHLSDCQIHFGQLAVQLQEAYDYFDNLATLSAYIRHNQGAVVQYNHQHFWEIIIHSESPTIYSDFQDGWNRFCYQLSCQLPDSHVTFDFRLNGSTQGLITLYHDPTGHYVLNFQQNNSFDRPYYAGISWEDPCID